MSKTGKKLRTFVFLLVAFTLFRLPYMYGGDFVRDKIIQTAETHRLPLEIGDVQLGFPLKVKTDYLRTQFNLGLLPLPLALEQVRIEQRVLPLFTLRSSTETHFSALSGSGSVAIERGFFGGTNNFEIAIDGLELSQYPLLQVTGLSGRLSLKASFEKSDSPTIPNGTLEIELTNGRIPGARSLKPTLQLLPLNDSAKLQGALLLDALKMEQLRINLSAEKNQEKVVIEPFTVSSNLGSGSGKGRLLVTPEGSLQDVELQLELDLSEAGRGQLGGYLSLAAGISPEQPPTSWQVSAYKTAGARSRVNLRVEPK